MRALPLRTLHLAAGATLGEVDGAERLLSYGEPARLALAARAGAGLVELSNRGRLAAVGPDRSSWLQGMVTADVGRLEPGQGCAATAVTAKGRLVAALRIFKRPDELWLDVDESRAGPLAEQLRHLLIMEDCELVDRSERSAMLGLHGPRALSLLRGLAEALPSALPEHAQAEIAIAGQPAVAIGSRELGLDGIDLWLAPAACAPIWEALRQAGATPIGGDAAELLRLEAGRPRFGAELDEGTLPLEAGLERTISYDKGCYVGQEIIARATYRGHVNRKLVGLWLSGEAAAPAGTKLALGDKEVGELRSSAVSPRFGRPIALGYARREALAPGTSLPRP
ncbi:MAG: CAF17-like 4Fe-4S cluster assembly/insertion protein YgfZ, partial [Deltaproteobacteria bacterium]